MVEATKYQFDVEFGDAGQVVSAPVARKKFTFDEVEQIKAETYAAGEASTTARASESAAEALTHLANQAQMIVQRLDHEAHTVKEFASQLALLTAQTLSQKALEQYSTSEIEAIVEECLQTMPHLPQIIITVAEGYYDVLEPQIQDLVAQHHFTGRVKIATDNNIAVGDCRIEWPNGGLVRDINDMTTQIQEVVTRHLQAEAADLEQYDLFDHANHMQHVDGEGEME